MPVYDVNYYPAEGKYSIQIMEDATDTDIFDLYKITHCLAENSIEGRESFSVLIEKPTYAEALATASGILLEARAGCEDLDDNYDGSTTNIDMQVLLRILIDYFRGGEPALETAVDLEALLRELNK